MLRRNNREILDILFYLKLMKTEPNALNNTGQEHGRDRVECFLNHPVLHVLQCFHIFLLQ